MGEGRLWGLGVAGAENWGGDAGGGGRRRGRDWGDGGKLGSGKDGGPDEAVAHYCQGEN